MLVQAHSSILEVLETHGRTETHGFLLVGGCLSELQLLNLLFLVLYAVSCKGRGRSNVGVMEVVLTHEK